MLGPNIAPKRSALVVVDIDTQTRHDASRVSHMSTRTLFVSMIGLIGIAAAQDPRSAPQIAQTKPVLQLRGDRFPGLTYYQMTPAQKSLTDRALANRGTIGTFNILLRSP